jgi:serine/threonine protein phosphatase PrpC
MSPEDALLFVERTMDAAEVHRFCAGAAAVFSTPSPEKDGEDNEDAAGLIPFDGDSGLLVVADGMGGARGGAQASSTTLYEMCAALESAHAQETSLREAVMNGIESANREVSTLAIGAATTLAAVEIRRAVMRTYHVGDSGILVVGQKGKLKHQTIAHSPVGYALESGMLDERQALRHAERHVVCNVIGTPEMRIEVGPEIELAPRDTVLVACDGLFDNLSIAEIVETLRKGSLREAAQALVDTARERMAGRRKEQLSKPDDLTLVAFRLDEPATNGNGTHPAP